MTWEDIRKQVHAKFGGKTTEALSGVPDTVIGYAMDAAYAQVCALTRAYYSYLVANYSIADTSIDLTGISALPAGDVVLGVYGRPRWLPATGDFYTLERMTDLEYSASETSETPRYFRLEGLTLYLEPKCPDPTGGDKLHVGLYRRGLARVFANEAATSPTFTSAHDDMCVEALILYAASKAGLSVNEELAGIYKAEAESLVEVIKANVLQAQRGIVQ